MANSITLGTAQLGIDGYGIANQVERLNDDSVFQVLDYAMRNGVRAIDTARAYGKAESRIGRNLERLALGDVSLITKLSPLSLLPNDANDQAIIDAIDASIFRSCYELRLHTLPVVMLHRWEHYQSHQGRIWKRLVELHHDGIIRELGASVYQPEEAVSALKEPLVRHLQVPVNLLDKRWIELDIPKIANSRSDCTLYARSIYLQGLLVNAPDFWPYVEGVNAAEICATLETLVSDFSRESLADLCMAYILGQEWIDSIVVGVETKEQLEQNFAMLRHKPLTREEQKELSARIPNLPLELLDPSKWNS
jgi:aryl-alcohol dehydrogenase-like predicted oxidoreductase